MNIAYLCFDSGIPILGHKGASVHVREFTRALAKRGHEITLVCARLGTGNSFDAARAIELIPYPARHAVFSSELKKIAYNNELPDRVSAALSRVHPDAIYERSALFSDAGATVASRAGIPRILEVNAPRVREQAAHGGLNLKAVATEMERRSYGAADRVIAVSEEVAAHAVAQGVRRERISVLPNGVDAERFSPGIDGSRVRKALGSGNRPVVGFVGSLKPWHGLDRLLEVFASDALLRHNPLLAIVGDGPEFERLRTRIAREALEWRVILTGSIPHAEIPEYLAAMDVTVAPYEPQNDFYFSPMKIVESLAAGRPVIAPKLGQIPSLITHLETGYVYDPYAPNALTDGLLYLLDRENVRLEMGSRAAARIRATGTWAHNAAAVETILENVRAERRLHHAW